MIIRYITVLKQKYANIRFEGFAQVTTKA